MVFRERTLELKTIAKDTPSQCTAPDVPRPMKEEVRKFFEHANTVSRELVATSSTLGMLSELLKTRDVFNDYHMEIANLTGKAKRQLKETHGKMEELIELRRATTGWTPTQADKHTDVIVRTLETQLLGHNNEFKDLLQSRTENLKETQDRRLQFSVNPDDALLRSHEEEERGYSLTMKQMVDYNSEHHRKRLQDVQQIEKDLRELHDLFLNVHRLAEQQGDVIIRIDTEVEEALEDISKGQSALMQYLHKSSQNRWLLLKIFGVLFFFIVFFGVFILK